MHRNRSRKRKHSDSESELRNLNEKIRKLENIVRGKLKKRSVSEDSSSDAGSAPKCSASSRSSSPAPRGRRRSRSRRSRSRRSRSRDSSSDGWRTASPILNRPSVGRSRRATRDPSPRRSRSARPAPPPADAAPQHAPGNSNPTDGLSTNEVQNTNEPVPCTSTAAASTSANAADSGETPNENLEEILQLLGDDPSVKKVYGKDIQKDLAVRLEHIATNGLTTELRKELKERYPIPANCTLIDAPGMNPEIKGVVSELLTKRLKAIELKQKQTATAISCLSEAITELLAKEEKEQSIVKLLMDACRVLCDSQHNDSLTRRGFIMSNIKKDMRDQLKCTKIDSLLFGQNLTETVKTAKAINRSGVDLKASAFKKPQPRKADSEKPTFSSGSLNGKDSTSKGRPPRNPRRNPPAARPQHASSSRTSRSTRRTHRK